MAHNWHLNHNTQCSVQMKNILLALILFSFPLTLLSQEIDVATRISAQIHNLNVQAYIEPFNKKDIIASPDREYYFYYHKKIQSLKGGYLGDLLNGKYQELDEGYRMVRSGFFRHGLKHGDWREWDPSGELITTNQFKNGKLHGKFIYYDKQGRNASVEIYKHGKKTGRSYRVEDGKKMKMEKKAKPDKDKKESKAKKEAKSKKKTKGEKASKPKG